MSRIAIALALSFMAGCVVGGADVEDERSAQVACGAPAFRAGTAYAAGARVSAVGRTFACKPWPYTGWCTMGGAYEPGVGFAWRDAWTEVTSCGGTTPTPPPTTTPTTPPPSGTCNSTAWVRGTSYRTGDVVSFGGRHYVATHDNPGYDPTISTWFWSPTTCGTTTTPRPPPPPTSTCTSTAWAQGTWYRTGDVVSFASRFYVATHDNPGYDPTISTWFWSLTTCGPTTTPTPPPPVSGDSGLARLMSRDTFHAMFPNRNAFYTYEGLIEATKKYPAFSTTGTVETQKRELAAFLANVSHETAYLVYVEEIAKGDYSDWNAGCKPVAGKQYFGRGPIQLSWNYNYCAASQSIFGDPNVLREDPDRVAREAWVAWATGIWFWMTSTGAGSMTAHDAMVQGQGFGQTIRTINGTLECGGRNPVQVQSRIDAYRKFCALLGVDPGANLGC